MSNITREEAIAMLKSKMDGSVDTSYEWAETVRMAIEALQDKPTGEWIKYESPIDYDDGKDAWDCSLCGAMVGKRMNFCPNCGADMRGDTE